MLTQTAEYALRAMGALAARKGQTIPATELASQADVPPPYLAKIMQQLASENLVTGRRGIGGGYTLSVDPEEVTALDVIRAVSPIREPAQEGEMALRQDGFGGLDRSIDQAAQAVIRVFEGVKLKDIEQDLAAARKKGDTDAEGESRVGVVNTRPVRSREGTEGRSTTNGSGREANGSVWDDAPSNMTG